MTRLGAQPVDTNVSAGPYSSGRPAAWETNSKPGAGACGRVRHMRDAGDAGAAGGAGIERGEMDDHIGVGG